MTRKEFNLRKEREKRNLRQIDVCSALEMPEVTYARHEKKKSLPKKLEYLYRYFFEVILK